MRILIIFFATFVCLRMAHCQQAVHQLEVGMKTGDLVYPKSLMLLEKPAEPAYLLIDGDLRYYMDSIKYYKDASGYYTWIRDGYGSEDFRVRRMQEGRVSTYTYVVQTYRGDRFVGDITRRNVGFFQKGDGAIREINYRALHKALKDNPESIQILEQTKRNATLSRVLMGLGTGLIFVGMLDTISQASKEGGQQSVSPFMYTGVAVAVAGATIRLPYGKRLRRSIEVYNQSK